jgi:capsular exopolysaccharide synthesis family protein
MDAKKVDPEIPKQESQTTENRAIPETISHLNDSHEFQNHQFYEATTPHGHLSILREWWQMVYRHKLLIISVVTLIMPFVIINAYRKKPIYQATSTIDVRMEGSSIKPNDIFVTGAYDNTKAEAFIIKSRPVIERTVANLKLDQNHRFLDVNSERSVWGAIAALRGVDDEQQQNDDRAATQEDQTAVNVTGNQPHDKVNIELSEAERHRLAPYVSTVLGNLKVDSVRDTRLLRITFTHTDPEIAAIVSNGVAQNFIDYNFLNKTQHFASASAWLEDSTRKLKARVQEAEQKLANYSRQHNIISLEGKENLTAERLARMHSQIMQAETDRILKHSLYQEVQQGRVAQLPEAFADPKTAALRKSLNDLAVLAAQHGVKFGAKHPKSIEIQQQMATIQEQIDSNRSTLEDKLKADYERAIRDEESLRTAFDRAKADAVQQNQAAIQYSILQQDQATSKALYDDFLKKTSQASVQLAEQYNNVRLIEAADVPGGPVGPNRRTPILMWLFLSLGLGVGLAWLLENLNTKVRSIEDVNRSVQLPVLAAIPSLSEDSLSTIRTGLHRLKNGDNSNSEALDQARKPISPTILKDFTAADEAYRMLRTSILLSTAGCPPRTIMITSAQPGDGKTTTVINTAIAFTQLKTEVLIIDCDMRRPMIHKLAHLEKQKGLSTLLSGGGNVADFIRPTPIPYLSILPCGLTPPNPSELISSESMSRLLNFLANRYKYILVDSPPLITVTDSLILSTMVDGVILVARSGKNKSETLRRAFHNLTRVRARVLGIILNDLNVRGEDYDYYFSHNYRSEYSDQVRNGDAHD